MYDFQRIENFTPVRQQIINVFHNSFSVSEGESEGALIRTLVEHLLENIPVAGVLHLGLGLKQPYHLVRAFHAIFSQHCVIAIQVHFVIIASPYVSVRYAIFMASPNC